MRAPFRLWGTVAALVALHFLVHLGAGIGRAAPDLLTLALLVGARNVRMGTGSLLGLVLGLLEDSLSVVSFGANSIAMTVVGALGARTRDFFVGDSLLFGVLYLFAGKWVRDLVMWMAMGSELRGSFVEVVLLQGSLSALYLAVVGVFVMSITGTWGDSTR